MSSHAKRCIHTTEADLAIVKAKLADQQTEHLERENIPPSSSCAGFLGRTVPRTLGSATVPFTTLHARPIKRTRTEHDLLRGASIAVSESSTSSFPDPLWDASRQKEIAADLCELFIGCGWPWNSADNPSFHQFFDKYLPHADLPDRRKLSGPLLDSTVRNAEERIATRVQGRVATGQCDGWKNIAKTNVITSMMTVERVVSS